MKVPRALPAVGLAALALVGPPASLAADQPGVRSADRLEWRPAPPAMPSGARVAVLSGDPGAEGPFVVRTRLPPDYEVPAHNHPNAEHITVLEGTLGVGHGDVLDRGNGQELRPGDFVELPAGHNHSVWAGAGGAVIQMHGQGPFAIRYVDPSRDPRRSAAR
jgi:quercetin dioxygenase-like cupin family protein